MKLDDSALFYHSHEGNCVMGTMQVIEESHQDPTTLDSQCMSVTFEPVKSFNNPVSLSKLKEQSELSGMILIRQPRLAVSLLNGPEYKRIITMGM